MRLICYYFGNIFCFVVAFFLRYFINYSGGCQPWVVCIVNRVPTNINMSSSGGFAIASDKIVQKHLVLNENYPILYALISSLLFFTVILLDFIYFEPANEIPDSNPAVKFQIAIILSSSFIICILQLCAYARSDTPLPFTVKLCALLIFVFCCYGIERAVQRTSYISVYVSMMCLLAVLIGVPKFFSFAVCLTYVSVILPWTSKLTFLNKTLTVWSIFLLAIMLRLVLQRIFSRVSGLTQTLLVLKARIEAEVNIAESIVLAQLPKAVLREMQKAKSAFSFVADSHTVVGQTTISSSVSEKVDREVASSEGSSTAAAASVAPSRGVNTNSYTSSSSSPRPPNPSTFAGASAPPVGQTENHRLFSANSSAGVVDFENGQVMKSIQTLTGDVIARDAAVKGIVPLYTEPRGALSVTGVDRRLSAVIAIKLCTPVDGSNVGGDNAMRRQSWHAMLDLFDRHAKLRKITCVRKYGDVWVGCLGFFKSWKNSGEDCYNALDMSCVAVRLGAHFDMRVCCAVDYGSVIGGFIHEHLSFDLIGQEVRWVLSMVEINKPNEVFASATARTHAQSKQQRASGLYSIKFHKSDVSIPIISSIPTAAVYVVSNVFKMPNDAIDSSSRSALWSSSNYPVTMTKLQEALLDRVPFKHSSMSAEEERKMGGNERMGATSVERFCRSCEHSSSAFGRTQTPCAEGNWQVQNPWIRAVLTGFDGSMEGGTKLTTGREFSDKNSCCFCRYGLSRQDVERTLADSCKTTADTTTESSSNFFSMSAAVPVHIPTSDESDELDSTHLILRKLSSSGAEQENRAENGDGNESGHEDENIQDGDTADGSTKESMLRPLLLKHEDIIVQVLLLLDELCLSSWWDFIFLDSSTLDVATSGSSANPSGGGSGCDSSSISGDNKLGILDGGSDKLKSRYDSELDKPAFSPYMWEQKSMTKSSSDRTYVTIAQEPSAATSSAECSVAVDVEYSEKLSWQLLTYVLDELSFIVYREDYDLYTKLSGDGRRSNSTKSPKDSRAVLSYLSLRMGNMFLKLIRGCCSFLGWRVTQPASDRRSAKVAVSNVSEPGFVQRPPVRGIGHVSSVNVSSGNISSGVGSGTSSPAVIGTGEYTPPSESAVAGTVGHEPSFNSAMIQESQFGLLGELQKSLARKANEAKGMLFHAANKVPAQNSYDNLSQASLFEVIPIKFFDTAALQFAQYHRSWGEYLGDVCVITPSVIMYRFLWLVISVVAWTSVREDLFLAPTICTIKSISFFQLTAFYFVTLVAAMMPVAQSVVGLRFVVLLLARCFLLCLMSFGNCSVGVSHAVMYSGPDGDMFSVSDSTKATCDAVLAVVDGDSTAGLTFDPNPFSLSKLILVMLLCWIPSALQTKMKLNGIELLCFWVVLVLKIIVLKQYCSTTSIVLLLMGFAAVFLMLFVALWLIRYCALFCYVLEHRIVQSSYRVYHLQTKATDGVLNKAIGERTAPNAAHQQAPIRDINWCPTRYNNCDIIAIHIKAADILPGLVPSRDLSRFLAQMFKLLDHCVRENGLTKISHFSGVYFAAICRPLQGNDSQATGPSSSSTVTALRYIQQKLDRYNAENRVNVAFGIGVCRGSLTMGLLGNGRFCYDCTGIARDTAYLMAIHEADGLLITDSVANYLPGVEGVLCANNNKLSEHSASSAWLVDKAVMKNHNKRLGAPIPIACASSLVSCFRLSLDVSAGGRSLEDMEYVTMLGQGGYGSVHLMREVATSDEYAVKAIPRKGGSSSAKLIRSEFLILQQMQHPNVINFKYCIMTRTRIYLVMNYVRGGNLKQIVERLNLDISILILWYAELILALEYVHGLGIIHRDVKPANCIIGTDGHLMLADFGLSKAIPRPGAVAEEEEDANFTNMSNSAVEVMRKVFPTKPKIAETDTKEQPISILLIDAAGTRSSNNFGRTENVRVLNQMYFDVVHPKSVEHAAELYRDMAKGTSIDIILLDIVLHPVSNSKAGAAGAIGAGSILGGDMSTAATVDENLNSYSSSILSTNSNDSTECARGTVGGITTALNSDFEASMAAGLAALKRVKSDFPNIPVIVVSSHDQLTWLQKLLFNGAKEVLISPLVAKNRDIILKYGRISRRRLKSAKDTGTLNSAASASVESSPGSGPSPASPRLRSPTSRDHSSPSPGAAAGNLPATAGAVDQQDMVIPSAGILQRMSEEGNKPSSNRRTKSALRQEILRTATISPQQTIVDAAVPAPSLIPPALTSHTTPTPSPSTMAPTTVAGVDAGRRKNATSLEKQDGPSASVNGPPAVEKQHSAVGTLVYMAPEVLCGREYDRMVDYWATGVTFYECATGTRLFTGRTKEILVRQIVEDPIDLRPVSEISRPLGLLVLGLLNRRPDSRIGFTSAEEIKQHEFFAGISWSTISHTDPAYKPTAWQVQPVQMKNIEDQKRLFYGETPELKVAAADPFGRQEMQEMETVDFSSSSKRHRHRRQRHRTGSQKDTFSLVNSISNKVHRHRSRNNINDFHDLTEMRRIWVSEGLNSSTNKHNNEHGLEHDWDTVLDHSDGGEDDAARSSESESISSSWGSMFSESASGVLAKSMSKKQNIPAVDTVDANSEGAAAATSPAIGSSIVNNNTNSQSADIPSQLEAEVVSVHASEPSSVHVSVGQ